jgi:hypothetical protein
MNNEGDRLLQQSLTGLLDPGCDSRSNCMNWIFLGVESMLIYNHSRLKSAPGCYG